MARSLVFHDLGQDIRIAIRSLIRIPILSLTVIMTVGVGIGTTAAIFSAIDAALLQPLPYAHPERLVRIYTDAPPFKWRFSAVDYLAFREQQTQFEASATYTDRSMIYSDGVSSGWCARVWSHGPSSRCSASGPRSAATSPNPTAGPALHRA